MATRRVAIGVLLVLAACSGCSVGLPGTSYDADPPRLSDKARVLRDRLRAHVYNLAADIGERNGPHYDELERARHYIETQFRLSGYEAAPLAFDYRYETFYNVEAVLPARRPTEQCLVVGAHYDSAEGSPGANDNASGVAVLLELAREFGRRRLPIAVRFVAFANEESPFFDTGEGMGSVEYTRGLTEPAKQVRAMLSLETVGFYSNEPQSQHYPSLIGRFYPDRGNFIAFVGNIGSRSLLRQVLGSFRRAATLPSEGAALPAFVPGVAWSDQRSFWAVGVPAVMVTDTAVYRDPEYHRPTDTPERLDYERMARLVLGLVDVVTDVTSIESGNEK